MSDCMTQEDAERMDNRQAVEILKPLRDMMRDQHGCPISDAFFALNKAIEALSAQPEQIYGEDIYYEADGHCEFKCSVCGVEIGVVEGGELDGGYFKFCPKCGVPIKENDDD